MTATLQQRSRLGKAIKSYAFPLVCNDFGKKREILHNSSRQLEEYIRRQLLAENPRLVKDGLSNVLYWGYSYSVGIRNKRVSRFRSSVTAAQIGNAMLLFQSRTADLRQLARVGLPEFSGMAFLSKLRMFLDPENYGTLDSRIAKLRANHPIFCKLRAYQTKRGIAIPLRDANIDVYQKWCAFCVSTASRYFKKDNFVAVDIERGIYQMIGANGEGLTSASQLITSLAS